MVRRDILEPLPMGGGADRSGIKRFLLRSTLAAVTAALLVLSSPGSEYSFLAWFALTPLFVVIRTSGLISAGLYALLAGQLFYFGHLSWFWSLDGITPVTFTLAGLANTWLWGIFGVAANILKRNRVSDVYLFSALWVLMEFLHHHQGFLSLTWGTLAYTQYDVPTINWIASLAGLYGVSFIIVLVNGCLAHLGISCFFQKGTGKRPASVPSPASGAGALLAAALLVVMVVGVGLLQGFRGQNPGGETFKAALVQAGLPGYSSTTLDEKREALRRLQQLSLDAAKEAPLLIVWPETAVPGRIPYDSVLVKILSQAVDEAGISLLVGAAGYDKFRSSERQQTGIANAAFLFKPGKRIAGRYEKMMLVPFNEYLPLRGKVKWPRWIAGGGWKDAQRGSELTVLAVGGKSFGVQICWENLFPDLFRQVASRGVDFMVSITNESFVRAPAARKQMLAFNTFRAIENHVSILRAASTGISAIIDPRGRVTMLQNEKGEPLYGAGKLVGQVQATINRSFYNRHGDWLVVALAVSMCLYFIILLGDSPLKLRRK